MEIYIDPNHLHEVLDLAYSRIIDRMPDKSYVYAIIAWKSVWESAHYAPHEFNFDLEDGMYKQICSWLEVYAKQEQNHE